MTQENTQDFKQDQPHHKTLENWEVDKYIQIVKENNESIKKFKEIAKKRKEELDRQLQTKVDRLENENSFLLTTLNQYAKDQEDLRSTKTQYKWEGLSGDVIIKKSLPKTTPPSRDKYEEIAKVYPEFVEDVQTKKVLWGELKKRLVIQAGNIYDKETGEDVHHLFNMEIPEERTEVK